MATKVSKKKVTAVDEEKIEVKKKPAVKKTATRKKAATKAPAAPKKAKAVTEVKEIKTEANNNAGNYNDAYIIIDHPIEMETIYGNHYAIRVGASPDGYVEISFNNGEWQPCRYDAGYWWFDWTYFSKGDYAIAVRLIDPSGNAILETSPRKCRIC
ncbi:MAG: hypothetical protein LBL00_04025 [Endomicrobium sp.]|jgi:hypothetical protein|nr:hypothetical protein [Endomicrobium sp.]